ncbi:glycosyltransferase [Desulfobacter sp.]|uniref:glycosyltransferase n=1 Tax=Desulfobacter sp. TaxID=2294 RepID=UPI003D0C7535
MKIGLQTWGSDGDIRPFMALAGGLSTAGHDVTVAFTSVDNKEYSSLACAMNFKSVNVNKVINYTAQDLTEMIKPRSNLKQKILVLKTFFEPVVDEMYAASLALGRENDLVISHAVTHTLLTAAEKYNRPRVVLVLCPIVTRTAYAPPIGRPNFGKLINTLLWRYEDYVTGKKCYPSANTIRAKERLPSIKSFQEQAYMSKDLTLIAASPSICEKQPDWQDNIQICGFFDVPCSAEKVDVPDELQAFLNAGDPPVYMTFGSLTQYNLEQATHLMVNALKHSGRRAIIQSDWDHLPKIPDSPNIYKIKRIPHHGIFPHCSLVVHHGGVGTSHTSLRCGCPSVVVEHAVDQIYWGQQLHRIGVAGEPLHKRSVTPEKLACAMNAVLNCPGMMKTAKAIGAAVKNEQGVRRAVELIENRFG